MSTNTNGNTVKNKKPHYYNSTERIKFHKDFKQVFKNDGLTSALFECTDIKDEKIYILKVNCYSKMGVNGMERLIINNLGDDYSNSFFEEFFKVEGVDKNISKNKKTFDEFKIWSDLKNSDGIGKIGDMWHHTFKKDKNKSKKSKPKDEDILIEFHFILQPKCKENLSTFLDKLISMKNPLYYCINIIYNITQSLITLLEKRYYHNDIKLKNFIVNYKEDGTVYKELKVFLIDFGEAKSYSYKENTKRSNKKDNSFNKSDISSYQSLVYNIATSVLSEKESNEFIKIYNSKFCDLMNKFTNTKVLENFNYYENVFKNFLDIIKKEYPYIIDYSFNEYQEKKEKIAMKKKKKMKKMEIMKKISKKMEKMKEMKKMTKKIKKTLKEKDEIIKEKEENEKKMKENEKKMKEDFEKKMKENEKKMKEEIEKKMKEEIEKKMKEDFEKKMKEEKEKKN